MSFGENVVELVCNSQSGLIAAAPWWERVPQGDIANILNGYPWKSSFFNQDAGVPLIRIRDVTTGRTDTFYNGPAEDGFWVEPGDLLVGMDGDFNCTIWSGERALLNQRVCKITPDNGFYLKSFLARVLPGYLKLINDATHSTTVKHLSSKTLTEVPLPLPPKEEQRRIVAKIDTLSAKSKHARDHLDHVPRLVEKYKEAVLRAAFSGRLIANKFHDAQVARKNLRSMKFEIPITWDDCTAEDVCAWITKGTTPPKSELTTTGGVPFIKVYNLTFTGKLNFTIDPTFINKKCHQGTLKRSRVFPGDVLINIVGPPLGKVSVVPKDHPEWNINQAIAIFRPLERIDGGFLSLWLSSPMFLSWAIGLSKATAGQSNLTLEICRSAPIPLPSIVKQREIVRLIENAFAWVDRLASEATSARKLIDHLDQAVLSKAFRGELVPQDPDDEPASALLERIKAEGAGATVPRKGRGRPRLAVT